MGWGRPPLPGLDTPTPPTPAPAVALRSGGAGARHLEPRTGRPGVSARPTAREDRDRRRAGAGGPSASPGVRGWRPRGGGGRSRAPHAPRRPRSAPPLAEPVRGSQPPGALVGCGRLTLLCAPWAAGGGGDGSGRDARRLRVESGAFGHPWKRPRAGPWSSWGTRGAGLGDRR